MNAMIEKLKFTLYEQEQNFTHIYHAVGKLKDLLPLTDEMLDNPDIVEHIDQFIFRWIKIQDSMGRRLIPTLLELIEPSTDEMTFLDKLHKLEKLGLLESEQWNIYRSIRNNLTHIYPEDKQEARDSIKDAYSMLPELRATYDRLKQYAENILSSHA